MAADTPIALQHTARLAGLLYLLIAVCGIFSIGYMPATVFDFGDAAANAQGLAEHAGLFRLGIFADMLTILFEIALTAILYALLKPVSSTLSLMAAFARLGMIVVMAVNLVAYLMMALVLSGADFLAAFDPAQLQGLALMFLQAHEFGVYAWQIFFGAHLLVLGYLVLQSGYLPRVLGSMMLVGSFGYSLQAVEKFVLPGNGFLGVIVIGLLTIVTIGEIGFALWLLVRGLDPARFAGRAGGRLEPA